MTLSVHFIGGPSPHEHQSAVDDYLKNLGTETNPSWSGRPECWWATDQSKCRLRVDYKCEAIHGRVFWFSTCGLHLSCTIFIFYWSGSLCFFLSNFNLIKYKSCFSASIVWDNVLLPIVGWHFACCSHERCRVSVCCCRAKKDFHGRETDQQVRSA